MIRTEYGTPVSMSRHRFKVHLFGRRVDALAMAPKALDVRHHPRKAERTELSTDEDLLLKRAVCAVKATTFLPVVNSLRINRENFTGEN